jgi:hypothetical protein
VLAPVGNCAVSHDLTVDGDPKNESVGLTNSILGREKRLLARSTSYKALPAMRLSPVNLAPTTRAKGGKLFLMFVAILTPTVARSQALIPELSPGSSMRLLPSDSVILDLGEPRSELPCVVRPDRPELGFDFKFHSRYQVSVAMNDLVDAGDLLTVLFRVVSEDRQNAPVYFVQKIHVPVLEVGVEGRAELMGAFLLGEGKYHVDWLMRDRNERFCASSWDVEARVDGKDAQMSRDVVRGLIQPVESPFLADDSRTEPDQRGSLLNVMIIVNFAPQDQQSATLSDADVEGLAAILREIARDSRIGSFSVVACSIKAQQIIYRQSNEARIDLPALGEALKSLNLARVDVKQLSVKNGETEFLANLTMDAVKSGKPDGLIFVSPKYPLDVNLSRETIDDLRHWDHPVFYLNYNLDPALSPWRDGIGHVVKRLGGYEYTIRRPWDLSNAWSEIVALMLSSHSRRAAGGGLDSTRAFVTQP